METITRNPKWTRDEIILALNTYFKVNVNSLSAREEPIVQLSSLLQKLSVYGSNDRTDTYRNPSSVHMKLMNFYGIEFPGKGLQNASRLDRQIYEEFAHNRPQLENIANKIIETILNGKKIETSYEDEGFMEGAVLEK